MSLSNIPIFYDFQYTDEKGNLTKDSHLYNDQLNQTLISLLELVNLMAYSSISENRTVNLDGLAPASKTTAEIVALEPNVRNGTIWFNEDISKLQVKTATGVVQTIQSV